MKACYETKWISPNHHALGELPGRFHPVVEKILVNRGVKETAQMEEFLSECPQLTHDPFQMKGMDKAVTLIIDALNKKQKIVFYGDYDVDGMTSVALLLDFFYPMTSNIEFYIPLREEEGYGLNREALLEIKEDYQADLVVTVDCGISAVEETEYAKKIGLKLIITDHHMPGDQLPDTVVVNPKQPDCDYPFKELSGCGVAFKLAQALQKKLQIPKTRLTNLLDLVALATVCDVVPLRDENRTMVKYGIQKMRTTQRPGFQALLEVLSIPKEQVGVRELGFRIGPHFNASGRIDDARMGVQLLVTRKRQTALMLAERLRCLNDKRRKIQEIGLDRCHQLVVEKFHEHSFLVVDSEELHEGVIGIIAGRLRDAYYRPTLVLTPAKEKGIYTGSGRSVEGFHLFNELKPASHLMERFGGHANACGLKIREENIHQLRDYLQQRVLKVQEQIPDLLMKKIHVADHILPEDLSEEFVETIKRLEPYGMGNEKPYFLMKHIQVGVNSHIKFMGEEGQHLKISQFMQAGEKDVSNIEIISFGISDEHRKLCSQPDAPYDLVFFPQVNEFRGNRRIQMLMLDVKQAAKHPD
ncbi:single-stranded-DNA-specific exonuclease RecJ [Anoxynatronum buryatiense]|uniref:Single-stranded-DNA-specific exonuclease RecJ n=1 Tax=Anoxynatronum buryatiense TaxID=489973 RepID=A0AA45WSL6_9CLOT|nr:single-stranded-DNA-specific exonuclease RecJ [Anoxynatronum buryatiense]SMP37813.1 single-stranded-DNA-specific exonuclease [Anoxynatronum buryatiense]